MAAPSDNVTPRAAEATLHILMQNGEVVEYDLHKPETRIGKGPQNDLVIADSAISAAHAMISVLNGKFTLQDLGSRNGTLLNEARLSEPRGLQHGDLIKMGHCSLSFRLKGAETTLSNPRTEILDGDPPPPPPAPPAPKAAALTEESLAAALVAAGLVARAEIDRVYGSGKGRRLCRALLEERLASEIGLRDLISRTFNIAPVELKTTDIDTAAAAALRLPFLRDRWVCPIVSQQPDKLMLAMADPTDRVTIEEAERITRRKASLRLATVTEIRTQVTQHFTPRLVGVIQSTGEKIEAVLTHSEIEIGKAPHNRLVLNDATVSGTHAIIVARNGGHSIADLGSSNGVFVNGKQIGAEAHTLQHGDRIQLGQVLLTFRNPSETSENKTAKLSPDMLEEIRQRALTRSLQTLPEPGPKAQDDKPEKKDKKEKDREKKKKKEDDRLKAAWVGGLSRIVAQVLGVLLTVGTTIYLLKPSSLKHEAISSATAPSGAATASLKNPPLVAVGNWTSFKTGLLGLGERIEASGVQAVAGSNGVLLASDKQTSEVLWAQLDDAGAQTGSLSPVALNVKFKDPEAITFGNGFYYLVTSQASPQNGAENALVRFTFDARTKTAGRVEIVNDLRGFLLANLSDPTLKVASQPDGLHGGLNVEGIAWDPNEARLLLGLRSPQLGKSAALLPLKLRDPQGALSTANLQLDAPIYLSLGGQGVRDIAYDPRLKNFLILSGSPETQPKSEFALWEWSGTEASPIQLMTLEADRKPEGITSIKYNDRNFVFVVGDAGSYLRLDYAPPK